MSMGMSMGMGMYMSQRIMQTQVQLNLPPTNWSLLKAFNEEGDQPLRFKKKQLDFSGLELEERLRLADKANEVFRFSYVKAESKRHYKIPLFRDTSIEINDIREKISREEYETAKSILNGAGRLQRIVRAVPCHQIYQDIKYLLVVYHPKIEQL